MRIGIVAPSPVPFTIGGAERAWTGLAEAFNARTPHDAELIKLPVREDTLPNLIDGYRRFAALDVSHFDIVITSKYPAWMVEHPHQVVYLFHRLRGLYDTYDAMGMPRTVDHREASVRALQRHLRSTSGRSAVDETFALFDAAVAELGPSHPALAHPSPLARELVHWLDDVAFDPGTVRRVIALSQTVAEREDYIPPAIPSGVAYLPGSVPKRDEPERSGLFTASRLDGPKRFDLLIAAIGHLDADISLRIAGTGPALDQLRAQAAPDARISFLGHISDQQLQDEYARAVAVPFIPADEDYGLITVEAMRCATPVLTCHDSGGPTEIVKDGETGLIVDPDPLAIAIGLKSLAQDPELAHRLGRNAQAATEELTWDSVIDTLLGTASTNPLSSDRPRIVVATTYSCTPAIGGGQLRCRHLYGQLTTDFDVTILSLGQHHEIPQRLVLDAGFFEEVIPRPWRLTDFDNRYSGVAGLPVQDITAAMAGDLLGPYLERLRGLCSDADAVVLAHPYLYPAVRAVAPDIPVIYDAHNVELDLKRDVLPHTKVREELLETVQRVEHDAAKDAILVSACAEDDQAVLQDRLGLGDGQIILVPNGADVSNTRFVTGTDRATNSALFRRRFRADGDRFRGFGFFIASWHPPNFAAAEALVELAETMPDVLFVLAGGHTKGVVGTMPDNVERLGIITDVTKAGLLASADVALNPMLAGGGSNLKLVEYLAAGVPVVSTPTGARGFATSGGQELLIAEIDGFGSAIETVLGDPAGAEHRARAGRQLAEASYDWSVLGRRLRDAMVDRLAGC